jgi:hypothetical protein
LLHWGSYQNRGVHRIKSTEKQRDLTAGGDRECGFHSKKVPLYGGTRNVGAKVTLQVHIRGTGPITAEHLHIEDVAANLRLK